MTAILTTHEHAEGGGLSSGLTVLLATGAGLAVASNYYCQPMLAVIAADLHASDRMIGFVPMVSQLGYASGILLLAPLGDRVDRRRIILAKAALLTVALLIAASAPSFGALLLGNLVIGIAASIAQDIVPAAASLAPPEARGRTVGKVMTGLLLGILLSRVVAGVVAEHLGWRAMYVAAAGAVALLGVALHRGLPRFVPTSDLPYRALLGSLATLWRQHPELRRASIAHAFLALPFGAFWSTLAVYLHRPPFELGSTAAGAFGLAGAAGALAAPISGRLSDRRGPELVTRLTAGRAARSFASMALAPLFPVAGQLAILALATVGFDLGVQAAQIAHQTIVYGIEPAARSRLNAIFMVTMFLGMASGGALGTQALARWGWPGVVVLTTTSAVIALAVRLRGRVTQAR